MSHGLPLTTVTLLLVLLLLLLLLLLLPPPPLLLLFLPLRLIVVAAVTAAACPACATRTLAAARRSYTFAAALQMATRGSIEQHKAYGGLMQNLILRCVRKEWMREMADGKCREGGKDREGRRRARGRQRDRFPAYGAGAPSAAHGQTYLAGIAHSRRSGYREGENNNNVCRLDSDSGLRIVCLTMNSYVVGS